MSNSKKNSNIIWAVVLLIIGVLFCFSLSYGVKGLSYIIGISIMLCGLVCALSSISNKKSTLSVSCLIASFLISFGYIFIRRMLASIIIDVIPWILLCVGALIVIDAFLLRFLRNDDSMLKFIMELLFGAVVLTFGLVVKYANGWSTYSALVLGIAFIVYAIYLMINEISVKKK